MTTAAETTAIEAPAGALALERVVLPIGDIDPDPRNRRVLDDEEFQSLADSIRLFGLLQPIHVRPLESARYELVDGERRWRAAQRAGLQEIVCDVWPAHLHPSEIAFAGFALNEHRRAPGCVQVARRLRDMKNERGLTHEQLAAHSGLPLDRVKTYFSLFGASDFLITHFENHDVPLKVAVEFVRYEKATTEGQARRLVAQHVESHMTAQEICALRKRTEAKRSATRGEAKSEDKPARVEGPVSQRLLARLESVLARGMKDALPDLEKIFARLGYRLMPIARKE
jgi:ParB family chromosome partitioning protein